MHVLAQILVFAFISHTVCALPHKGAKKHHTSSKGDSKNSALLSRSARLMNKQEQKFLANRAEIKDSWRKIWGIQKPSMPQQPRMASKAMNNESKGAYPPFGHPMYGYGKFQPNPIAPLATAITVAAVTDAVKPHVVKDMGKSAVKPNIRQDMSKSSVAGPPVMGTPTAVPSAFGSSTVGPLTVGPPTGGLLTAEPQVPQQINDQQLTMQTVSGQKQWLNWWGKLPAWRQKELRLQTAWNNVNHGNNGVESTFQPAQPQAIVEPTIPNIQKIDR